MKKFVNRSLFAFLGRYFDKIDENQSATLISDGKYEEENISLKSSFLQNFQLPFIIKSNKIDNFKIDTSSSKSVFSVNGINLIAMYSDCSEFNPYQINPPSLSFFTSKFFSEKTVKKILFSFFFKFEKIDFIVKNGAIHFEVPRCNKADNKAQKNNISSLGSFGFMFDEISLSESNAIKISNLSIYIVPRLEHMNIEKYESFKSSLKNDSNNLFVLKNFDYERPINNLQINKEIILDFSFSQISFIRLFNRKLYYSNCGCPNVYTKDDCSNWWAYTYRCFLQDRRCFNIESAISFLKNRQSFNPNFQRDQFLMFNTYKKFSYRQNNSSQEETNLVDFTNEEKDGFVSFLDQSSTSSSSTLFDIDFNISFLHNLKIRVRNTSNGILDLGQISIQRKEGSIIISSDKIILSYDFLPFLFNFVKDKLIFKNKKDTNFELTVPSIKIVSGNEIKDPIGSIEINNLKFSESGFSIESIQNTNKTLLLSNIVSEENSESASLKKKYTIDIQNANLTTKILFNLIFYKNKNYNSSTKLNLHYFFYLFKHIEYILSLKQVSLFIGNDQVNNLSFKMHFVNTFQSLVIGVDNIIFGKIIKEFYFTATINYNNEGRSVFFDLDKIKMSLFSSEIPQLMNLLTEIKPFIFKYIKLIPHIECLVFCSKGFNLTLEMPEYSLVQLNISECTLKSVNGISQFSINDNQALFYDRKLNKWCVLIQPFNITSNIQRTSIDLFLSLQFNFTRIFFNDINRFFTNKDDRIDLPRKVKVKNLTFYNFMIEEMKEEKTEEIKTENKKEHENPNKANGNDESDENNNNNNNNNENDDDDDDGGFTDAKKTRLGINETAFLNSKKFRIEVENPLKKTKENYIIDSNHLQFPLYISNEIVLSKGDNSICFCSPFVLVNKTTFNNINIYEISKNHGNNDEDDYKVSLVGSLKSRGTKLGIYRPNVFITGETDIGTQIFANYIHNEKSDEEHEYKMLPIVSRTIDKKPLLYDIIYNGNKETILVSSEFDYEKGSLFITLMNPFVIVNQVPECKSVSLSLTARIAKASNAKEKKQWFKHNINNKSSADNEETIISNEINELLPYEKASIPLKMIPFCSSFYRYNNNQQQQQLHQQQQQQQQQVSKLKSKNKNVVNNSFDIIVKLNDFLGFPELSIKSNVSHVVISEDFQFNQIQFSETQFTFSLALKTQFNPRKGNWTLVLFAPSVIENKTNLDISINSIGKANVSNFFCARINKKENVDDDKPNRLIFGCDSFFNESRSMPVFVGYNREYKLSEKPIDLCFSPYSSPLLLPSLIHKNCYLPLVYKTSSLMENKAEKTKKKQNHFNELYTVIDYYKIIENNTTFDFTLTPIDNISNQDSYASFASNNNSNNDTSEKSKRNKNKNVGADDDDDDEDDSNNPEILFKQNEKKPILFATSSFCYKFSYKETSIPICLLRDNYRTCFRVDKSQFVLLTITEKVARFEMSDFSPQKVYMTFTNLIPNDSIFVNTSTSQPPIIIEPNSTSLFGFDSPFESKDVSIFALSDQIDFKVDRCYEPVSSSMNKFIVQTISDEFQSFPGEIVHSVVVRSADSSDTNDAVIANSIINSPNGENLNINSNLKDAMKIEIKMESEQNLNTNDSSENNLSKSFNEDDNVVQSRIMNQYNDKLGYSYDIDDYDCFAGYSLNVNLPIFEISLIDDRLTELALICLYQSSFKVNHDRSMMAKSIQFSIKSLQVFDMNMMTLFPTVISSNPDNSNFLSIEVNYFDRKTVDQLKVSISPILISPDINFLNELYYFFRKINNVSEIVNRVKSNDLICQPKLFNLVQIDPIIIVLNIKAQSSRNLNTPKLVTFNKNLTSSFALNGFIIHNTDSSPSFFIEIVKFLADIKLYYSKIFYIQNPNEIPLNPKNRQRPNKPTNSKIEALLSTDPIEERIVNPNTFCHFFSFPSLSIEPLIEKNLKDKPAKILDALSQTESYFKLASDKMRLISNDKIDRDQYLIPPRKRRRSQTTRPSESSSSITADSSSSANNEPKVQGSVKKERAANAAQTVANGFSSAAKSLGSGITGIIRKPIEGGKENGAKGAFKGIGQGLLGVLTCTVSSVIEVGSGIAGGIRKSIIKDNTSNYEQCRPPSTFLLRCISTNSANNSEENNNNYNSNSQSYRFNEDVKNNFDDDLIETAELAQQAINGGQYLQLPREKEESLLFFSDVEQNQKRISYIGITLDSIFLFNSSLSVLNKIELDSITWFKKKSESLSNNDVDFNLDMSMRRKIVFDQFNKTTNKSTRYELELPSENNADLAVQFFSSKLRIFDIIREVNE